MADTHSQHQALAYSASINSQSLNVTNLRTHPVSLPNCLSRTSCTGLLNSSILQLVTYICIDRLIQSEVKVLYKVLTIFRRFSRKRKSLKIYSIMIMKRYYFSLLGRLQIGHLCINKKSHMLIF